MAEMTPRDRALAGEVVKVTDERLAEMQRIAIDNEDARTYSMHWHWAAAINELIAARKEIERLTARVAELEKERDRLDVVAREAHAQLQRVVEWSTRMQEAYAMI